TIMTELDPYLSYKAGISDCLVPPEVNEKTLYWINNYKIKSSFNNFYPHITLGISKLQDKEVDINFIASRLAIGHLGNYCTCRKILDSVDLV
ncbi:MAG: hypothetical protein ACOZAJ_01895, partial [Patescibacteria group bacterium]